jgi:hypothetical protein
MADVERIAPTIPTLPSPTGRSVGSRQRRAPQGDRAPRPAPKSDQDESKPKPDHIDEYV